MPIYCIGWQRLPQTIATRVDQKQVSDIVFSLKTQAARITNAYTVQLAALTTTRRAKMAARQSFFLLQR